MKITVGRFRSILHEAMIAAHPDYIKKERVREALQGLVIRLIASQGIVDQAGIDSFFADLDMSLKALKMIPYDVWVKMSAKKP